LINRYRQSGLLIDTNLLIMFFIGFFDPQQVSRFGRTDRYDAADFYALAQLVEYFRRVIVTPHILAEVSNLSGDLDRDKRYQYMQIVSSSLMMGLCEIGCSNVELPVLTSSISEPTISPEFSDRTVRRFSRRTLIGA